MELYLFTLFSRQSWLRCTCKALFSACYEWSTALHQVGGTVVLKYIDTAPIHSSDTNQKLHSNHKSKSQPYGTSISHQWNHHCRGDNSTKALPWKCFISTRNECFQKQKTTTLKHDLHISHDHASIGIRIQNRCWFNDGLHIFSGSKRQFNGVILVIC